MQIKTHIGVSVDGFIATPDGWPALLSMPSFDGPRSFGHPEFIESCGAVVMGRTTFLPALGAADWPWPGYRVFVLTTRPLPPETPDDVVTADDPAKLLELMQDADFEGDVHLVGGQRTIESFRAIGALDSFGVVTLPLLLGDGMRLTPPAGERLLLKLESFRAFPDGAMEHIYTAATEG